MEGGEGNTSGNTSQGFCKVCQNVVSADQIQSITQKSAIVIARGQFAASLFYGCPLKYQSLILGHDVFDFLQVDIYMPALHGPKIWLMLPDPSPLPYTRLFLRQSSFFLCVIVTIQLRRERRSHFPTSGATRYCH